MEITFKTTRGAELTGEVTKYNTMIINGVEFGYSDTDHLLYTKTSKGASLFLESMGFSPDEADQVKLAVDRKTSAKMFELMMSALFEKVQARKSGLEAKFAEAKRTGQPVLISSNSYETSGYVQVVNKHTYAMPDGSKNVVTEETH